MASVAKLEGVNKFINNLKKQVAIIGTKVEAGLAKGGLLLQRESMKIVPVDLGPLRESAFCRKTGSGINTVVRVGYTMAYAIYVHENPNALHGEAFNQAYAKELKAYKTAKAKKKRNAALDKKKKLAELMDLAEPSARPSPFRKSRGKNQQYKFLEKPAREKRKEIVAVIIATVKS